LPDKYARTTLSRFFRYCSAQAVRPALVTDEVAASFLTALEAETLVKQPRVIHQNVARLWNRMRRNVAGWPDVTLTVPSYNEHYILPESTFPASFRQDLDAYLAKLGHDDILDLDAPPRPLRARTLKSYRCQLLRFASMLVHRGHPAARITSLAYLVDPKHVEDGLRFLLARHSNGPVKSAFDLALLLGKVAKHWTKSSPDAVSRIRRLAQKVRPRGEGLSSKNRRRLAPLRDERTLARLFLLPGKIRKDVAGKAAITRADALLMQHAVALMILTYAPLRIGNLAQIHVERNLRWSGPNMTGTLVLDIDGAEVKNGQTLSFPLPADCADLVREYLRTFQPRLVRGSSPYLFPSDLPGRPKRGDTLGKQLSRLIRRSIGLEVNPHLYRHLVHLVVLNRYPGAYAMISRILGHKSLQTAIANYAGEDIAIAMRAFHELIAEAMSGHARRAGLHEIAVGLDPTTRKRRA
jgi:integrase